MADTIAVALFCGEDESGSLLREVVRGIGRRIVHDVPVSAFDPDALAQSGANVVVVDLSPDAESDAIYDLLDDDRYRVIFNESEVSSRLSGWEHARWARHLAAKILDVSTVIDPPRPEDVAAAQAGGNSAADAFVPPPPRQQSAAVTAEQDAQRDNALGIDDWLSRVMAVEDPARRFAEEGRPDADSRSAFAPGPTTAEPESGSGQTAEASAFSEASTAISSSDLALDALMLSAIEEMRSAPAMERTVYPPGAAPEISDWSLDHLIRDIDEWLPPAKVKGAEREGAATGVDAARLWSPPVVSEQTAAISAIATADSRWAPQAPPIPTSPSPTAEPAMLPGRQLDLSAQEESVLKPLFTARPPSVGSEMRVEMVADPGTVSRVIVLCASIGGPEAIRQLLGALPANYPALFLVVQQIGDEFMDMLVQQLRRSTPLQVRAVNHGDQLRDGDVVPVPPRQRLLVERDGRVSIQARIDTRGSGPSMDQVLHDVSDRFGSAATAVVLSGVGADAVDGCLYLSGRGGKVYVQNPASCVAATMVEQVQASGVVSFLGTPPELASRLLNDQT